MTFIINDENNEKKLLDYLRHELNLSRGMVTALKKRDNGILLNGEKVTVRAILRSGDVLFLAAADNEDEMNDSVTPVFIPLDIIYEDENIVAVNKPLGMPTHPSLGHYSDTLANALAYYYREKNVPFVFRAVSRLDRDTSGAVIVAKNRTAAFRLSSQHMTGKIKKCYIAAVCGYLPEKGHIIRNIKRKSESIIEREVCRDTEGQYAKTEYAPMAFAPDFTIVKAYPITGRTHQLRVHFASIGHPIIGDTLYGCRSELISRQALHCSSVTFLNLSDGKPQTLTAPLPEDISKLLNLCPASAQN